MRSNKHIALIKSQSLSKTKTKDKSIGKVDLKQERSQHVRLKNTIYLD